METAIAVYDPSRSLELQKVGVGLFKSGLFPNAKNEYGAYAIVQYGAELGIGPMMSLKNINIISGQLACNAQLMLSLALQKGVTYEVLQETNKGAKIKFRRGSAEYTSSFSEQDAKDAGLLGKDNWKKYARDMYFWRTVAKGIRRVAPDAIMGLYTPDEISEGKYVDVAEIPPETEKTADTAHDVQPGQEITTPDDTVPAPEVERTDYTKLKALAGDLGAALRCPDLPKGKNVRPKSDCNQCQKTDGCPAWVVS